MTDYARMIDQISDIHEPAAFSFESCGNLELLTISSYFRQKGWRNSSIRMEKDPESKFEINLRKKGGNFVNLSSYEGVVIITVNPTKENIS